MYTNEEAAAQQYYNDTFTDRAYTLIWGGEHIHYGIYEQPDDSIPLASQRTVELMAATVGGISSESRIIDLGAGYGGSARLLARRYGCHVTCLNISEAQNQRNERLTAEQGLTDRIEVRAGSFEAVPYPDRSFDIAWAQDAILHSARRRQVFAEVRRIVRPGGAFIFTDPLQQAAAPPEAVQRAVERLKLSSLETVEGYRQLAAEFGMLEHSSHDLTPHILRHYQQMRAGFADRSDELAAATAPEFVDRLMYSFDRWIEDISAGYLAWYMFHFTLPE